MKQLIFLSALLSVWTVAEGVSSVAMGRRKYHSEYVKDITAAQEKDGVTMWMYGGLNNTYNYYAAIDIGSKNQPFTVIGKYSSS